MYYFYGQIETIYWVNMFLSSSKNFLYVLGCGSSGDKNYDDTLFYSWQQEIDGLDPVLVIT